MDEYISIADSAENHLVVFVANVVDSDGNVVDIPGLEIEYTIDYMTNTTGEFYSWDIGAYDTMVYAKAFVNGELLEASAFITVWRVPPTMRWLRNIYMT